MSEESPTEYKTRVTEQQAEKTKELVLDLKGSVNLPSELIELLAQGEENQAVPTTQSKQTEERMDLDFRDDSDMLPSIRKELVKFLTNLSQIDNTGELAKALQDRGDKGADEEVSSAG